MTGASGVRTSCGQRQGAASAEGGNSVVRLKEEWAGIQRGLSKYPLRALHLSGLDARFGGVHFSGPPHFGPLTIFLVFFC